MVEVEAEAAAEAVEAAVDEEEEVVVESVAALAEEEEHSRTRKTNYRNGPEQSTDTCAGFQLAQKAPSRPLQKETE